MSEKEDIRNMKKKIIKVLRRYGVIKAGIFGSFATGKVTRKSDVDILVKIKKTKKISLLDIVRIERELEEDVGRKIDIVEYCTIHPRLKDRILREEVRIL